MEYPKLNPGDKVILGEHIGTPGTDKNWSALMDKYVGKETTIEFFESDDDGWGEPVYRVAIDSKVWQWRIANMTILSGSPSTLSVATKIQYGVACSKCSTYCPDAESVNNFKCYSCSH